MKLSEAQELRRELDVLKQYVIAGATSFSLEKINDIKRRIERMEKQYRGRQNAHD